MPKFNIPLLDPEFDDTDYSRDASIQLDDIYDEYATDMYSDREAA